MRKQVPGQPERPCLKTASTHACTQARPLLRCYLGKHDHSEYGEKKFLLGFAIKRIPKRKQKEEEEKKEEEGGGRRRKRKEEGEEEEERRKAKQNSTMQSQLVLYL